MSVVNAIVPSDASIAFSVDDASASAATAAAAVDESVVADFDFVPSSSYTSSEMQCSPSSFCDEVHIFCEDSLSPTLTSPPSSSASAV